MVTSARILADGLYFGEGPRWRDGRLWFSDFYDHAVKSADAAGSIRTELEIDDQPSGLGWLPDGRLLVVAMHRRQLLRVDDDGVKLHADLAGVAAHHANDMVVDREGRAYVGNFGFALDEALAARGVECVLAAPGGRIVSTVETSQPCFACALGGAEGRTLFALTAPTSVAAQASAARRGRIEVVEVATGAAASQPAAGR